MTPPTNKKKTTVVESEDAMQPHRWSDEDVKKLLKFVTSNMWIVNKPGALHNMLPKMDLDVPSGYTEAKLKGKWRTIRQECKAFAQTNSLTPSMFADGNDQIEHDEFDKLKGRVAFQDKYPLCVRMAAGFGARLIEMEDVKDLNTLLSKGVCTPMTIYDAKECVERVNNSLCEHVATEAKRIRSESTTPIANPKVVKQDTTSSKRMDDREKRLDDREKRLDAREKRLDAREVGK